MILKEYYGSEVSGTAELCYQMDKFFDILDICSTREHLVKRKDSIKPFLTYDDEQSSWLEIDFLLHLRDWKETIEAKDATAGAKENIFCLDQHIKGCKLLPMQ